MESGTNFGTKLTREHKPPRPSDAVHVRFENSTSAAVDLSYLLDYGGVFEPLRDSEYFRQFTADPDAGTIVWPNEADYRARDALRARSVALARLHSSQSRKRSLR